MNWELDKWDYIGLAWTVEAYIDDDGPLGHLLLVYRGRSLYNVIRRIKHDINEDYASDGIVITLDDNTRKGYVTLWDFEAGGIWDPAGLSIIDWPKRRLDEFDSKYGRDGDYKIKSYLAGLPRDRRTRLRRGY